MDAIPLRAPSFCRSHRLSCAGFSLVELLAVIAIIGVLAAIVLVSVAKVRTSARAALCSSNLRQIGVSANLYAAENRRLLPQVWGPSSQSAGTLVEWSKNLYPYLPQRGPTAGSAPHEIFNCPAADYGGRPVSELRGTYGAAGGFMGLHASGTYVTESVARHLDSIPNPTRAPWVIDMAANGTNPYPWNSAQWAHAQNDSLNNTSTRLDFRHGERLNILFADGHVSAMRRDDLVAFFVDARGWDARP